MTTCARRSSRSARWFSIVEDRSDEYFVATADGVSTGLILCGYPGLVAEFEARQQAELDDPTPMPEFPDGTFFSSPWEVIREPEQRLPRARRVGAARSTTLRG